MSSFPRNGAKVQVLVGGTWRPATFQAADSIACEGAEDEVWWMNHFALDDGDTVPDDITSGDPLPPWRYPIIIPE